MIPILHGFFIRSQYQTAFKFFYSTLKNIKKSVLKINRKDWGLNWNSALETGGVLVSEEVKLEAELQFVLA